MGTTSIGQVLAAAVAAMAVQTVAEAALITGDYDASPAAAVNLTALGTTDWAVWSTASAAPTNSMAGGSAIANLTYIGSGTARAVGAIASSSFQLTYTNGTNPTQYSGSPANSVTDNTLGVTGNGVQFSVTNPTLNPMNVYLYVSGYDAEHNTLRASLPGAATFEDTSSVFGTTGTIKPAALYSLQFTPDSLADGANVLTVQFTLQEGKMGYDNAHVVLSSVAVSIVPEPALIAAFGMASMLALRKRSPMRG